MPDTALDNSQDFITDLDVYLFQEGTHRRVFEKLGAHSISQNGVEGVHFALWAPNAASVAVVGDFNGWNRAAHPMQPRGHTGIWTCFIPECQVYQAYKYALTTAQGLELPLKADPFAFASELRPATASKIAPALQHKWGDAAHRSHWQNVDARRVPISIYEVHAGSWQRDEHGQFLHWDALAAQLIPYVVEMGFTHIEFMPIAEHPYDPSWGYQVTGLYAPSARFGDAAGFARFVDGAHRAGIGVLLDWVPAHFPLDEHGLARFDGTALYEHEDPRLGFHPDWNTAIYNYGRTEVRGFLINNALFWCEQFHIDGLRVDAVASMLYRDYSRKDGAWIPNAQGGRENWEAVSFLQEVNKAVYGAAPGVMMVAEESTAWPQVTQPVHVGGLGFGFKWNMGFMNDTLRYMARAPIHRRYHHNEISFGLVYAFSENFVLPLSHDEVVHGKGSLLNKMAGDEWQKFANLRAYYAFMWGYPGKKLLFMGQEFAQRNEWCESRALDWHLRQSPAHEGVRNLVKDLNHIYSATPALYARDCEAEGFAWLVVDDADNSVFAWVRQAPGEKPVAVVSNMTPCYRVPYTLPLPQDGVWKEILNSDSAYYGGSGQGNMGQVVAHEGMAEIVLPPLATLWLEWQG
jgi:1,4-alpha-glucan branching enzyme